ncbi:uncharacterized protein LOC125947691 [Dermacentor silvarum]|uniref:uncharacterized protein LOC125947691 n=1 Tax=Dermacentor silvarum TaxID=543639 RepID=UPI002101342B|nr:uncharacterized protein LOC125947691 [Dermacentor silvarum]
MVCCAIVGCNARTQSKLQKAETNAPDRGFFKVPKVRTNECEKTKVLSEERRRVWLARINRAGIADPDKHRVCSRHFLSGKPAGLFDDCSPDWAPSLHLGHDSKAACGSRYIRLKARRTQRQQSHPTVAAADVHPAGDMPPGSHADETDAVQSLESGISCQTEMTGSDIIQLQKEVVSLREELGSAKVELAAGKFTENALRHNDEKVSYYTGLPTFLMLFSLFNILKEHVSHSSRNVLTQFEELFLFLMRMRLCIHLQDSAYRFKVSQPTVSRISDGPQTYGVRELYIYMLEILFILLDSNFLINDVTDPLLRYYHAQRELANEVRSRHRLLHPGPDFHEELGATLFVHYFTPRVLNIMQDSWRSVTTALAT